MVFYWFSIDFSKLLGWFFYGNEFLLICVFFLSGWRICNASCLYNLWAVCCSVGIKVLAGTASRKPLWRLEATRSLSNQTLNPKPTPDQPQTQSNTPHLLLQLLLHELCQVQEVSSKVLVLLQGTLQVVSQRPSNRIGRVRSQKGNGLGKKKKKTCLIMTLSYTISLT